MLAPGIRMPPISNAFVTSHTLINHKPLTARFSATLLTSKLILRNTIVGAMENFFLPPSAT